MRITTVEVDKSEFVGVMKVCDVCDLVNGRAFKPSDWGSSGLPIVRIQNLNNESAPFNYYSGEYNPAHEINDGELLFSWSGTPGTSFGAFRWHRGKGILNQHIYKVVPKINIDKDYLKYALNGNLSRIISKAHGGVGLQHITKKELNEITLRIVSNDEQRKIVAQLNQTQNVIELRRTQLAKLDELVKCRFVEMFGDPAANPFNWPLSTLGVFCDLQNGYAFKSEDYINNSSVLNCRMSNIRPNGTFDPEYNPKYLPDSYWDKYAEYRIFDGDVIIAMTDMANNPKILGIPTIVQSNGNKFLLNQRVGKLTFYNDKRINSTYLWLALSQPYVRQELTRNAGGCTQININKSSIMGITLCIPPMEQQNTFASVVHSIDKLRMGVQAALDKAQTLFDSLMQEYFG